MQFVASTTTVLKPQPSPLQIVFYPQQSLRRLFFVGHYLGENSFKINLLVFYIFDLLGVGGLAFNGDRSFISKLIKPGENLQKIDAARTDQYFLSQSHRIGGPHSILCMDTLDVLPDDFSRVHRFGFPVENQVRRIQPYAEVWLVDVHNRPLERGGCLLPCLHQEVLTVGRAMHRDLTDCENRLLIKRVRWILWNETAMGLDARYSQTFCKVRGLFQRVHSGRSRGAGHQANGCRTIGKIPNQASWSHDLDAGCR